MSSERPRSRKRSLNWDLVRLFAVSAVVPLLVLGIVLVARSNSSFEQARESELSELARIYSYNLVERLRGVVSPDLPSKDSSGWHSLVWGSVAASTLPPQMSLLVFDQSGQLLYQSPATEVSARAQIAAEQDAIETRTLAALELQGFRTASMSMPIGGADGSRLKVVLAEPRASGDYGPVRRIILVLATALLAILLYVIGGIRRGLKPLTDLQSDSFRVASGELPQAREQPAYSELASVSDSVNRIARSLDRRKQSLQVLEHLGQRLDGLLAHTGDEVSVIATVMLRASDATGCVRAAFALLPEFRSAGDLALRIDDDGTSHQFRLGQHDIKWLDQGGLEAGTSSPSFAAALEDGYQRATFAIRLGGELRGVLWADWTKESGLLEEGTSLGRSLARQLELGLSAVARSTDLDRFSVGAVNALARAIDAASHWTRGHSERVSQSAVAFAEFLGLDPVEITSLRRGGLVHDIGKIGIDRTILDKNGPLEASERLEIQRHPGIGLQILEPIPGFGDVLRLTHEHHEWWDGRGYPQGLEGDQIDKLARILAVVDVFDSLTSIRPYREPFTFERARDYVRDGAGTQFDPDLAKRFVSFLGNLGERDFSLRRDSDSAEYMTVRVSR